MKVLLLFHTFSPWKKNIVETSEGQDSGENNVHQRYFDILCIVVIYIFVKQTFISTVLKRKLIYLRDCL